MGDILNEEVKVEEAVKPDETKEEKPTVEAEDEKKYSDKDVDEIINRKFAKWQKDQDAKIEEEKRLSKLSADERAKEESKKKDEEIIRLRAEIDRNNLERDTVDRLNEEGLPTSFKSFLMGKNAEATNENIKNFKGLYEKAVQAGIDERMRGKTPKAQASEPTDDPWANVSKRYK